jgi:hypothetical protein
LPGLSEAPDRILVPISNPSTIEKLMDLAIFMKSTKSAEPIYALSVVKDDVDAREKLILSERMLEKALKHASSTENQVRIVTRTDLNIASGITRAIKDLGITEVVIGWNASISAKDRIFGSVLDILLENTNEAIFVCKINDPISTIARLVIVMPVNAEYEPGFGRWLKSLKNLAKQIGAGMEFYATGSSHENLKKTVSNMKPEVPANFNSFDDWEDFLVISKSIKPDDLLVVASARKGTVSHNTYLDNIPRKLAKYFIHNSFFIVYPEQRKEVELLKSLQ